MLEKNIYILYPPGYCGSYVSWAITKSDKDLSKITVDDPVNKADSKTYGGKGTAHLHHREPTHMGWENILIWLLQNKPTDKRIYIINAQSNGGSLSRVAPFHIINMLSHADPTGVFINIHDNDNEHIRHLGNLNLWTKWPIYFEAIKASHPTLPLELIYNLDSLNRRNFFVNSYPKFFPSNSKVDMSLIKKYRNERKYWFRVRYTANPHEINPDEFALLDEDYQNVYELGLGDILSEKFPEILENILQQSSPIDLDIEYLKAFHATYLEAQDNLNFLEGIKELENNKNLIPYMTSNPLVEAIVLQSLRKIKELPADWKTTSTEEITRLYRNM